MRYANNDQVSPVMYEFEGRWPEITVDCHVVIYVAKPCFPPSHDVICHQSGDDVIVCSTSLPAITYLSQCLQERRSRRDMLPTSYFRTMSGTH